MINKNIIPRLIKANIPLSGNIHQTIKNKLFSNKNLYFPYLPIIFYDNNQKSMRKLLSNKSSTNNWFKYIQNNIKIT